MKIFIMTDLEGVAGVIDRENWVLQNSRYYDKAKDLLTGEVNAAVAGLYDAGATYILVADGHGSGGLNHLKLDPRVEFLRGFPDPWPFGLDETFDCVCWIGQHAKASTEKAHLCHTGNHHVLEKTVNDVSVGEFGSLAYCADELGVTPIFATGDAAFAKEAEEFVDGIVTVSVKRGHMTGRGLDLTYEQTINRNIAATHVHPQKACEAIRKGAYQAAKRFFINEKCFALKKLIKPPYTCVIKYRRNEAGEQGHSYVYKHETSVIAALNSKPIVLKPNV